MIELFLFSVLHLACVLAAGTIFAVCRNSAKGLEGPQVGVGCGILAMLAVLLPGEELFVLPGIRYTGRYEEAFHMDLFSGIVLTAAVVAGGGFMGHSIAQNRSAIFRWPLAVLLTALCIFCTAASYMRGNEWPVTATSSIAMWSIYGAMTIMLFVGLSTGTWRRRRTVITIPLT